MKLTEIKIFSKSLVICTCFFALLLFSCESNEDVAQSEENLQRIIPSIVVKNVRMNSSGTIDGKVTYSTIKDVSFSKSGKLEKGDVSLSVGTHFKFNELLVKLNIEEAFRKLAQGKESFSNGLLSFEKLLEKKLPSELTKWKKFKEEVTPAKRLPQFPSIFSEAEKALIIENDIYILFSNLNNQESEIENYFYLAPYDGVVVSISKNPNANIKSGETIMKIARKDFFNGEFIVPLALFSKLKQSESVEFFDDHDTKLGSGEFKKAIRNDGQMKVIFSFKKENGIRISNNQNISFQLTNNSVEGCYLPKAAIHSNKVIVLQNGKKNKIFISIINEKDDLVFVTGLKDGMIILLN